jgi:SAM-dependent methyltransferase
MLRLNIELSLNLSWQENKLFYKGEVMCRSNDQPEEELFREKKEMEWSNTDNNAFYENLKAEGLKEIAENGGLASGCDIELLRPYWSKATSILEVGAGYGRVIDYLLKHDYQGKITAIERCDVLFQHLEKNYGTYNNIKLLHADVRYLDNLNEQFDLILMFWSIIAEFLPIEQLDVIIKLSKLLKQKGKLIIDTMPDNVSPLNAKNLIEQHYSMRVCEVDVNGYMCNRSEMKQYSLKAGFYNITYLVCQTDIKRQRWLYILS